MALKSGNLYLVTIDFVTLGWGLQMSMMEV
jgi:hypothetical protein